eukprot:TRINITY_DN6256_c1_g1_i1.p1 TRINITY_DN6256_c1_g1~~TRINITY_DN6256_c1_g1_i1.p1  ORF type:complete len:394 (+),score=80.55 TRINITY_DN6256_c1_g1_i1:761-1942(+)
MVEFSSDFNLYTMFSRMIDKLWVLWELVLLAEPIVVMANSPDMCSAAVLNLISLIYPLQYMGDYRPYFTIHDPEFQALSENFVDEDSSSTSVAPPPNLKGKGIILGVTNPLFRREFQSWPHTLLLANNGVATKTITIIHNKKDRTYNKTVEESCFISKYKPLYNVVDSSQLTKKLVKMSSDEGVAGALNDELLRRHFTQLTDQFMKPLESYFKHLVPSKRSISAWKKTPSVQAFKEADFLQTILLQGKKTKEVELYRKFIRTDNFISWFRMRKREATIDISSHYLSILDPSKVKGLVQDKTELEIVDFYLRVQVHHKTVGCTLSEALQSRVEDYKREILLYLPVELQKDLLEQGTTRGKVRPEGSTGISPKQTSCFVTSTNCGSPDGDGLTRG